MDFLTPKEQFLLLGLVLSVILGLSARQWRPRVSEPAAVTAEASH